MGLRETILVVDPIGSAVDNVGVVISGVIAVGNVTFVNLSVSRIVFSLSEDNRSYLA